MADKGSRAGQQFYGSREILDFVGQLHAPHDAGLARAFASADGERMPAIMLGPSEGKLLELLVRLGQVRRAVEIGTLAGYSALRIARALPEGGHVWTLESEPEYARVAEENLRAAGVADRVTVVVGGAQERLADLQAHGPFDAVFLDADKGSYDRYGRWAAQHLRPGGLLLADNAFFFGKLLDEESADARAMRRFHTETSRSFDSVCIPTPDGLVLGLRNP